MSGESGDDLEGFDFPYQTVSVPGVRALQSLKELKDAGAGIFTPVILGGPEDFKRIKEGMEMRDPAGVERALKKMCEGKAWMKLSEEQRERSLQLYRAMVMTPEEIIQRAKQIDVPDYFADRRNEMEAANETPLGEWPDKPLPKQGVTAHWDYRNKRPLEEVIIAKVPTPRSWEVPAFLSFGGWNDCPDPEIHVAVHRYWNENFGTDVISTTGDVIECSVLSPPTGREIATALAWEQFLYCTDIVHQGVETIAALADCLINGQLWYFWWD